MESHGIRRLKLALECIDRHPGEYEEKTAQNEMLRNIIREHNLTETVTRRQGRSTRRMQQELTVETYRTSLGSASRHKSSSRHKEKYWIQALFMEGSIMLDAEWLTKLEYEAPQPTEEDESDHEQRPIKRKVCGRSNAKSEDEYIPEDVAHLAAIDDSDDAVAATLESASPAAFQLTTVPEGGEELMAGPSQETPDVGPDDGPDLQIGLVQLKKPGKKTATRLGSPHQKRKSDTAEVDLPRPKKRLTIPRDTSGTVPTKQLRSEQEDDGYRHPGVEVQVLQDATGAKLTRKRKLDEEELDPRKKVKASQDTDGLEPEASTGSGKSRMGDKDEPIIVETARPIRRKRSDTQKPPESRLGARGNPTRGLLRLSDDDVVGTFEGIWLWVDNFSRDLFEAIRSDNDDNSPAPSLELYPELQEIYQILFGENWHRQAAILTQTESISALQLVQAVLSVAMYKAVWQTRAPWKEANEFMDAIAEVEEYINRIQQVFSPEHRIHTIMWHAIANRARDEDFRETTMRPYAEDLADKIMLTLSRLVNGLKTKGVEESSWPKAKQRVVRMLMHALTLKGKIKAAPNYYQWTWPMSGEKVDDERMEHIRQGEGEQEVLWAVTPIIERSDTKDDPWVLSSRAKVWCRPPMKR